MAITKTVLIGPPLSAAVAVTIKAAVRQPKSIEYFMCYSPVVIRNGKKTSWLRGRRIHRGHTPQTGGTIGWFCNRKITLVHLSAMPASHVLCDLVLLGCCE